MKQLTLLAKDWIQGQDKRAMQILELLQQRRYSNYELCGIVGINFKVGILNLRRAGIGVKCLHLGKKIYYELE